jgi:anionic cell wall polymer biosynthesis LytR-Cps2A-Psr (LCP) family protein
LSGYDAGPHTLNGEQALAFARDRQAAMTFSECSAASF